jgi:hypothetical protein
LEDAVLRWNLYFAWFWILAGLLTGGVQGLWFHRDDWLGGYGSWERRLTRLGHVAFLGTALLNIAFALSAAAGRLEPGSVAVPSILLLAGAIAMPLVCYLAAWKKSLRHLFIVPVASLVLGVAWFALALLGEGHSAPMGVP